MSFGSQYNLNQRLTYLEYIINQIAPQLPLDLDQILTNGNSAGTNDIDMNGNDILQVNNINLNTINGSTYPPPVDDLSAVLTAGNTANNSIILDNAVVSNTMTPLKLEIVDSANNLDALIDTTKVRIKDDGVPKRVSFLDSAYLDLRCNNPNPNTYYIQFDNAYGYAEPTLEMADTTSSKQINLNTSTGLVLNNIGFTTTYGNGLIDVTGVGMSIIAPNTNIYLGDVNGTANSTAISIDDTAKTINLTTDNGTIGGYCNIFQVGDVNGNINSTSVKLDDGNGKVEIQAKDNVKLGDYLGIGTGTKIEVDDLNSNILLDAGTIASGAEKILINSRSGRTEIGNVNGGQPIDVKLVIDQDTSTMVGQSLLVILGDKQGQGGSVYFEVDSGSNNIILNNTGQTTLGDFNNVSNGTKIVVDDNNSFIDIDSRGGKSQMGDINNINNLMKIVVDDGAGVINIDNGGDAPINIGDLGANGNATKIIVNDATATFTIEFPTINFSNTTTTTSTSNHNAPIRATSNGLESTTFLNCKLNGNDIWIPYFTTDPSL